MKTAIFTAIGLALAATTIAAPAEAGPFSKLKKAAKKVERTAEDAQDVVETVDSVSKGQLPRSQRSRKRGSKGCFANRGSTSASACTAAAPDHVGGAGPVPARFSGQLQCANLNVGNAFVARDGNYTFSQGISTETRSGLIDRRNVQASNGCLYSGLGVGDVLYVEFDKSRYKKYDYEMQCVSYDGSEQLDNTNGPSVGNYKGKSVMLHTGNSLGYTPTATGSNSDRSRAYDAHLDGRGRTMLTFNFGALHTDKSGTDFFCQWFNKNTGKSAVALTFRRGPRG
ncbi:hypothetical protein [Parerythrobacter jejuensis]|uniref:Uncharacterized protein n=1 Tax=Parerythrobacter jejuensis TaxID=795812 RepID=A0A845AQ13_9SPHN|nr:hypothetical protein [Parerythrobacter jejuensis]MXP31487.1 hypothetical protein [Parerythrobacter jejuensis]